MIGGVDLAAVILLAFILGLIAGFLGCAYLAYRANKRSGYRIY